ncbi:hypothetical protein LJB79_01335, partial [Bacteroides sp. OttesenSCG-928-M17]|nr:hypothetical protein [Bacteroides sp. OttesenSCG-928-M17]
RAYGLGPKTIEAMLNDFGLFERETVDNRELISSPYVDRVMGKVRKNKSTCSAAGKRSARLRLGKKMNETMNETVNETVNGMANETVNETVNETLNESSTTSSTTEFTTNAVNSISLPAIGSGPYKGWKALVDEAVARPIWFEQLARSTRLGRRFTDRPAKMVSLFKEHISLQGSGYRIDSVEEAQSYMTNFFRPGTKTWKRLIEQLAELEEEEKRATGFSPYEDYDPATGLRSYYGLPIPADAPPRPSDRVRWNPTDKVWD